MTSARSANVEYIDYAVNRTSRKGFRMSPMEKLFANLPKLPSMPKVVQELIASLVKDDIDIGTLVDKIKQDQALSARVLQMANSSAYGASQKIGSIDKAVTMIGLSSLRSVVIASGMSRSISKVEGVDLTAFWRYAQISAGAARSFGKREGVNPEFAYTAGLMHRLGQLIIIMAYPAAARQFTRPGGPTGRALMKLEESLIGVDHAQAGAELATRWQFPEDIANAIRWYAEPLNPAAGMMAAVVAVATQVTAGLEAKLAPQAIAEGLDEAVLKRLSLEREDCTWRIEQCRELASNVAVLA